MKTSDKGIHLMHQFEGYRSRPYKCSASIWTVGYGHAMYADQLRLPNVRKPGYEGMIRNDYQLKEADNREWSKSELDDLFKDDLVVFERAVLRLSPNLAGHQSKFDSVVCLVFNIGAGSYQRSTLRQRINRGDWDGAAEAFLMWSKAGGKVLKGLLRRREAEKALFLSE